MISLDDVKEIKKIKETKKIKELDKSNMLSSIRALPLQMEQAWNEIKKINLPKEYFKINNIVVSGMGGSALGAHIIKSVYSGKMSVPLEIVNDYHLPAYTDENSLVILSSYSGSTEETLSTASEAQERKAKILGITTGGKLGDFLKQKGFPAYIFNPEFNPCGQPRIGLGYSIIGQIGLLARLGILKVNENNFLQCLESLKIIQDELEGKAKEMVKSCLGKIILIIAAEHLSGNAHGLANQINENAKTLSFYFLLSELNHHLMEGLKNPLSKNWVFVFLASDLYLKRIKTREILTEEVISKNNIPVLKFEPETKTKFSQVFETLLFGSYFSFYLSIVNNQDPSPIPWVDYFKEKLSAYGE